MSSDLPQRLAAILAADIAGYTRLMELDEARVVEGWRRARGDVIDPTVARHRGRIVKLTGDGFLAEFSTAESAVKAALDMQAAFAALFADSPAQQRIAFRMGVNIGDIWVDAEDIYGAGVNVAARLESLARPGGICISGSVHDAVKHKVAARYEPMGPQRVKNVKEPILAWHIAAEPGNAAVRAPRTASRRHWLQAGAALAVTAAVGAVVARNWGGPGSQAALDVPSGPLRLAVLPFRDLSTGAEQEYLGDGITDEMISVLGRLHPQRLGVVARTSVMRYKDSTLSVAAIGRELEVDYVLEGSVLREGDTVRVNPALIDVRNETRLWGERYERQLSGMLALQRAVARAIDESLALTLLPQETQGLLATREMDAAAYDAYLQGRAHFYHLTPADLDMALEYFNRALEGAPDSALVHAWTAITHASRSQLGMVTTLEAYPATKSAAERALQLDEDLPEAHFAAAIVHTWQEWNWAAAERDFQRAIALNESYADVRAAYSHFLAITGRSAEGLEQIERAIALDPFNPLPQAFHSVVLGTAGRFDESVAVAEKVLQVVPDHALAHSALAESLRQLGRYDEELAEWRRFFAASSDDEMVAALDEGFVKDGYLGAMVAGASLLDARSRVTDVPAVFAARWHVRAENPDGALAWLERALAARDQDLPYISTVPLWDPLRSDPRFVGLLRRMNLVN
ncbi:MAG TPA: adenylate/guanylate cyclase domain-containing protein [Gammaproteobacteria bacterium]